MGFIQDFLRAFNSTEKDAKPAKKKGKFSFDSSRLKKKIKSE
ncbi:MAG: hypothetical protein Q7R70_02005 [Candidatus Diapherotrites archaeon]|nr:hypothetical protein [Candidatus Diapherotrites archaeon]